MTYPLWETIRNVNRNKRSLSLKWWSCPIDWNKVWWCCVESTDVKTKKKEKERAENKDVIMIGFPQEISQKTGREQWHNIFRRELFTSSLHFTYFNCLHMDYYIHGYISFALKLISKVALLSYLLMGWIPYSTVQVLENMPSLQVL